jgi:lysylphosphatidylglycerol synthetase-like protein (DUF2156 family)
MADVVGDDASRADEYDGDSQFDVDWANRPRLISSDALALTALVTAILSFVSNLPATVVGTAFRLLNPSRQSLRHVQVGIAFASAVAAAAAAMLALSMLRRGDLSERMRTVAGAAVVLGTTGTALWLGVAFAVGLYHANNPAGFFSP